MARWQWFLLEGGAACERPLGLRTAARRGRHPSLGDAARRKLPRVRRFLWRPLASPRPSAADVGRGRLQHAGRIHGFPLHLPRRCCRSARRLHGRGDGGQGEARRILGERGLMGGGAAGHELDRADTRLGTPPHAIIVGRAVLEDPTYQPVNEERYDHTWPAAREDIIRSDLTFFETPNGGAVFSVGSMNFIGALPIDSYDSVAARLITNIVKRFASSAPFPAREQPTSETSPQRKTISAHDKIASGSYPKDSSIARAKRFSPTGLVQQLCDGDYCISG